MLTDNRIVVALSKVSYARLKYKNQYGDYRDILPRRKGFFTVRSGEFHKAEYMFGSAGVTAHEYSTQHELLDVWTPILTLQMNATHKLRYTGKKAMSLWKKFNEMQFNKKGK